MKVSHKEYIVITGASKGLGKRFSIELARKRENLILIATPHTKLNELAEWLRAQHQVEVKTFECDLTEWHIPTELSQTINAQYTVKGLINNAGIGGSKQFEKVDAAYLDNIIMLNIRALTLLTRHLLPSLLKAEKGFILNIASMASFSPIPYKSIYPASKAFVYSFTRSLREELRDTNVSVSVVHPGPMLTNPDIAERIIKQGWLARLSLLSTSDVVNISLRQMKKGQTVIIPGVANKLLYGAMRWFPEDLRLSLASRVLRKEISATTK